MSAFRSVFAGLLLAAVLGGGVGAPLVHEAAHAAERTETLAAHAADGHHGEAADGASLDGACPTPTPLADLACALCHGLTAGLSADERSAPDPEADASACHGEASWASTATPAAPSGRGPPAA